MLGKAALGAAADIEIPLAAALRDLEPELGDIDHRVIVGSGEPGLPPLVGHGVVDDVVLLHVFPRSVVVKWGATCSSTHSGDRVGGDVHRHQLIGVIAGGQPGQGGGTGLVPAHAEHVGEVHRHTAGLVLRRGVVAPLGDLDGDGRAAVGHACHQNGVAGHIDGCHLGIAGLRRDGPVPGPVHRNRAELVDGVEGHSGFIQGQTARRLADRPGRCFRPRPAVAPLVVAGRRERGGVAPGVGAGGVPAHGQLGGVIAAPGGRLGAAGIGQAPALLGDSRNGGPPNRPRDRPGGRVPAAPLIVLGGGKGRRVRPGVGLGRLCLGQLCGVEALPGGGLGLAGIGQHPGHAGGGGDGGPLNTPRNRFLRLGFVAPGVVALGLEVGRVGARVSLPLEIGLRDPGIRVVGISVGDLHHLDSVVVPARSLGAPVVGQTAGLGGDHRNGVLDGGDSLRCAVGHVLCLFCGFRCLRQQIPHGGLDVNRPPDVALVRDVVADELSPGIQVDVMLPFDALRLGGGVAVLGKDRLTPVQGDFRGADAGRHAGVGLRVVIMLPGKLLHHPRVGLRVLVVLLHGVVDGPQGGDAGGGHADLQAVFVRDRQDRIELERVELVGLRRDGHTLAALLVLGVLDHHQELIIQKDAATGAVRLLRLSGVFGDGVEADPVHLVGGRIAQARHLDTGRHTVVRPGDALDGQRVGAAVGQLLQLDQVVVCADGTVCGGDVQNAPRCELGQQGRANVGYCRFRPTRRCLVFFHGLPPAKD